MKNNLLSVFLLSLTICACKKGSEVNVVQTQQRNNCIEWKKVSVTDHSGYTINNLNIRIINALFSSNNIDNSAYRYCYYSQDSTQTYFPPYAKIDSKVVRVKEFTNGLEIFNGEILFEFRNTVFSFRNGNRTNGTTLSTTPKLSVQNIRSLFLKDIEQFDHKGNEYKDSCFSAEFGYFNLNAGTNTTAESLIKCWKVTLINSIYPSEYPVAFYQDNDEKLIYYDNGIRTFR